jgi:hypothetical protein
MRTIKISLLSVVFILLAVPAVNAQDEDTKFRFSGELKTDQRFLYQKPNSWAWNENRLTLELSKKFSNDKGKFHTEVWLRNIGLPNITSSADLYNKGIVDPYNFEIREAYVQLYGFPNKNIDIKIGRQRIAWGTADLVNPTDNLNPYDLEDVLDLFLHGFANERGRENLNDYFFVQYEMRFFEDRLKIDPVQGAFIVSDWGDVKNNYALIYSPGISFMATDNAEITISSAIFAGKGNNVFAQFTDYDMFLFGFKYSF